MNHANQHYVPQFYFRNFSADGKRICSLLRSDGRVIPAAPFRHQCSRRNFYGSQDLEIAFSGLEAMHADAIRMALRIGREGGEAPITVEQLFRFLQAIMFQRGRTALEIQKSTEAKCKMHLAAFRHHINCGKDSRREEMLRAIDYGKVNVSEVPHVNVVESIGIFLPMTIGICDLHLCFLRNHTDYPFIFSDAPVVFYNTLAHAVRNRGVLGTLCPGLQIFYPLSPTVTAMLVDPRIYTGPWSESIVLDIRQRRDVSQLNALQLHHSMSAVYFAAKSDAGYVGDLWSTHRTRLEKLQSIFTDKADFLIDGKQPDGELMQMFEPQVNHPLSLSFIECDPVAQVDYVYEPRDWQIRNELMRQQEAEFSKSVSGQS